MKRIFITLIVALMAFISNAQSCPDGNHPHAIDLGLPSGTKWACCNVDTDHPENHSPTNYGGYYAWGETETKSKYDWSNYIHCDGSETTCHDIGSDIAGTVYDAAHVHWGDSWVMPSKDQIHELASKCSFTGTTMNGVDGGLFTGPNGCTIFLPAANIRWNGLLECLVLGGYYWSSTQSPYSSDAYRQYFDLTWGGSFGGEARSHGLTIRPVICGTNKYEPMLVDGKQWNYYCESAGGPNDGYYFHYVLRGEQEVGGHLCKVLYRSHHDGQEFAYAYLYEEETRIYYVNEKTEESVLLYDFSLQKGNVVNDPFYDVSYIVEDVSEKDGGRLCIRLKSLGENGFTRYWIEGVGSDFDLLLPLDIPQSSDRPLLLSVEVGGKTIYTTGYATKLNSVESGNHTGFTFFDLQGRRIGGEPKAGIYIRDGRKVVVR